MVQNCIRHIRHAYYTHNITANIIYYTEYTVWHSSSLVSTVWLYSGDVKYRLVMR